MNKVYKVVWNASLGVWVAVSEIAKGKTKNSGSVGQTVLVEVSDTAQLQKEFSYKKLLLAIFTVFTANFAHAGYEAGTASTRTNCTQTSAGSGGEATGAIAIGSDNSTASGTACAKGSDSIAIGRSALATGTGAVVLGPSSVAGEAYTTAIGNNAQAMSRGSVAIGSGAYANSGENTLDGKGAVAIGNDASALGKNSYALGAESSVVEDDTVSFGHAAGDDRYYSGTKSGTWATDRFMRLSNVANGYKANDAINVSQLNQIATILGSTGIAAAAKTGIVALPSYTITKTDGSNYAAVTTVPQAIANLNTEILKSITFAGNTGNSANKLGTTLNITGTGSTAGTYSGNNLKTSVSGNTVSIQMADAPVFTGTVTAGNLATGGTLSVTGVSNLNGGANLNNQKITNVAAGTASGDAVNFGQLTTTNNNVTTAQNAANAAQTSANAAQTTANSALTEAQKGLNFRANAGAADKVSLGETVTLADGTNTTVTYDAATNTYKYSVVDAPTFTGTVTAGNLATGGTLSVTGVSNLNGGANLNNQKITNVAAGTASGDAVNF
ncbi:ESPR-type extended signal peptide-containing protein, partial [Acinetobacter venetianus]|uniref:ESPR-type extended signal peptide-containing protein n=1 Tax=Acinetobacter venetianus TaxID=52133 RepID=UPI0007782A4B